MAAKRTENDQQLAIQQGYLAGYERALRTGYRRNGEPLENADRHRYERQVAMIKLNAAKRDASYAQSHPDEVCTPE